MTNICKSDKLPLTFTHKTGIEFQTQTGHLDTIEAILACETPIAITVDGNAITEPRGPNGLPVIGNFYEIFPDHMGNHQRLFKKYGPIIKTNNLGRINYFTNDPEISRIAYLESHGLFTKKTSESGSPLYGIRDNSALFTCDTETPSFALTHKFIPPSMSPSAVRHYAPLMQEAVQSSFTVFDTLDKTGLAINVYQFMVKLSGQLLCRFVLGHDPHHFDAPNSPLHPIMVILGQLLELNKEVQTRGDWYGKMPFGLSAQLLNLQTPCPVQ
jgi:cytochrome P450